MTQFRIDAFIHGAPGPAKPPDRQRKEGGEGFKTAAAAGALGILGLSVLGTEPGLQVWVTPDQAPVGEAVTFVYHVSYRNPERPGVRAAEVKDGLCQPVELLQGDANQDDLLGPEETWRYQCTLSAEELQAKCTESPGDSISHEVTVAAEDMDGRDLRPRRLQHRLLCEEQVVASALAIRTRPPPPSAHGLTAIFEHEVSFESGPGLWADEIQVEDSRCGNRLEGPLIERGNEDERLEPEEIWRYTCRAPVPRIHQASFQEPMRVQARVTARRSDGESLEAVAEPAAARIKHTPGRLQIVALQPEGGAVPFRVTYEPGADGSPATALTPEGALCVAEVLGRPDRGDGDSFLGQGEAWTYTCRLAARESEGPLRVPLKISGSDLDREPLEPVTASRLMVLVEPPSPPGSQLEIACRESRCAAFGRPPTFEYEVRYRPVAPRTAARSVEIRADGCLPGALGKPDKTRAADSDELLEEGESWFFTCDYWRRQGADPHRIEASVSGSDRTDPLPVATAACDAKSVAQQPPRRRGRRDQRQTLHFEDSPDRPAHGPRHGLYDPTTPLEFFGDQGGGPVLVQGHSDRFPTGNAAVVLDTFRRDVEEDLQTCRDPERAPAVPDPYLPCDDREYDDLPLGNVLIVDRSLGDKDRDGYVDRPNDEGATGAKLVADFSRVGLATVYSVTLLDVEKDSHVEFKIEGRKWPQEVPLPKMRNNHVRKVCFGAEGIRNVETMTIVFAESGAIDHLVFRPGRADGPKRRTGRRSQR